VAPALALAPQELSRYLLNTIFLNLLENRGYTLLHATSVARADRVLLLLGPHNSGKSTAALRLALHGYDFIADSLIGRAKLRQDMLQAFPDLFPLFRREITRDEIKFGVDLERLEAVRVRRDAVLAPQTIDIFLLQRHEAVESRLEEIDSEEAMHALFHNSAYWHSAEFWQQHMVRLQQLLLAARCRRLHLGTGVDEMLRALDD
jgi:hypothetical protein